MVILMDGKCRRRVEIGNLSSWLNLGMGNYITIIISPDRYHKRHSGEAVGCCG